MNKRLDIIDFARGFAIFTIVAMHLAFNLSPSGLAAKALSFGGAGVHIFFLCSGFGLYLSHLGNPLDYLSFLRRRFLKVYLPYLLAVVLWTFFLLLHSHAFSLRVVSSHLLLYKMFNADLDISLCYHYWFISTIVQFYLCWPLIVKLMKWKYGLAGAVVISLSWAALVGLLGLEESRPWGSFFLQYLWEFCLGMHLATKTNSIEQAILDIPWWALCLTAGVCMTATSLMDAYGGPLKLFNDGPSMFGYAACVLLVYKAGFHWLKSFFEFTSTISYEWYLLHGLVIVATQAYLPCFSPFFHVALSLVTSYGVAFLLSCLIGRHRSLLANTFQRKKGQMI